MKKTEYAIKCNYKGKDYASISELARELNIRTDSIYGRLKTGLTLEESVEKALVLISKGKLRGSVQASAPKGKFKIWNQSFNTTSEIEESFKLEKDFIKNGLAEKSKDISGSNIEKLIVNYMEPEVKKNAEKFKTITALARFYGFQPDNIYQRLKLGWSLTEAIAAPVRKKHVDKIVYKGKTYMSRAELAKDYNVDSYWVSIVASKKNSTWMKIFETIESFISDNELNKFTNFPSVIGSQYAIIYDGVWFNTIHELAKKHPIKKSSYGRKALNERLDYLKGVLGEPEGDCFNYKSEWVKSIA